MSQIKEEIEKIVHKETLAWDTQDANLLISIFHPDMVWPWPKTPQSHDPMEWILDFGRFNSQRWKKRWQDLFDSHILKHNIREIKKIAITKEQDGAFAVVDIDTLWIKKETNEPNHWKGRVCKVFTKVEGDWKLIMHTGVLDYS